MHAYKETHISQYLSDHCKGACKRVAVAPRNLHLIRRYNLVKLVARSEDAIILHNLIENACKDNYYTNDWQLNESCNSETQTTDGRLRTKGGCVIFITTITQQSEQRDIITGIFEFLYW